MAIHVGENTKSLAIEREIMILRQGQQGSLGAQHMGRVQSRPVS